MPEARRRRAVSDALLLDLLSEELNRWRQGRGAMSADVVDLGGGTGGLATSLAQQDYRVTVIDPSPDALASLTRRTAELALDDRIVGVQGDANDLVDLVGERSADIMICHRVLEVVDAPAEALRSMTTVLRQGGLLSLVVSQRRAVVLAQALAGHLAAAREALSDPHRFDLTQICGLVTAAGLEITNIHGIGAVADHVAEALTESAEAYAELYALERTISDDSVFQAMAPLVHLVAVKPNGGS